MKRRKKRESSRHSTRKGSKGSLPLKVVKKIVEFFELIMLSILYALINFTLFIWDHKTIILKILLIIIICAYCFFTSKSIIDMQKDFNNFKNYTENLNNDFDSKSKEAEELRQQLDSTETELEQTQKELEEVKVSKAKQKEDEEKRKAEQLRIAKINSSKQVTSRSGSTRSLASLSELQSYAKDLCLNTYGWSENDFQCLVKLWNRESGWNPNAHNKSSGAHGIPQSLPASKMASEGSDYYTNGKTQIRWGLKYIKNRYGSPSKAWSHSQSKGWY